MVTAMWAVRVALSWAVICHFAKYKALPLPLFQAILRVAWDESLLAASFKRYTSPVNHICYASLSNEGSLLHVSDIVYPWRKLGGAPAKFHNDH